MTCIVGLEHEGRVYIGGDSAGVSGWSLTVRADEKVFTRSLPRGHNTTTKHEAVFGFTSSFRMGQIIRYAFKPPATPSSHTWTVDDEAVASYLVAKFIPALREAFKEHGYQRVESERAEGGTFLMGLAGRLYTIHSDYQVGRSASGYSAVGCGDDVAKGALYASADDRGYDPSMVVRCALEAAEAHSAGVRGPFKVVSA